MHAQIIWQLPILFRPMDNMTSWQSGWANHWCQLKTHFIGGWQIENCIHVFPEWPWISIWFLVHYFVLPSLDSSTDNYSATAVNIEWSFSHGRILINHLRNRLRSSSICALMCFGDWCHVGLSLDAKMAAALHANAAGDNKKDKAKEVKDGWRFACIFLPVSLVG